MKRQPSIRRSLLIRCGIGIGVLMFALSTTIYLLVRHGMEKELEKSICQTAALLSNQVELEDGKITFEWQEGLGTNRNLIDDGLFQFWDESTGLTTRSPGLQSGNLPRFCGENGAPLVKDIILPGNQHAAKAVGLRIYPFVLPSEIERMIAEGKLLDSKSFPHILVVARDVKSMNRTLTRLRWILGTGTILTLALGFMLIDREVRLSLRPIDDLSEQVRTRTGRNLDSALDLPETLPRELSGLAEGFDALLARVAAIRNRERDFIRHSAHELRTPIAGLLATTDLALSQKRSAEEQRKFLEECQKTAVDLGELVKRLSALARIGNTSSSVVREAFDVSALLAECVERFRPAFDGRGIDLEFDLAEKSFPVLADKALCRIVLNNLLDNAATYASAGTRVVLAMESHEGGTRLRVSNVTDSVPDDVERWFEPLFRKNTSRHDAGSHLGIGLTLSREAALAMGGSLTARNAGDHRVEFILALSSSRS